MRWNNFFKVKKKKKKKNHGKNGIGKMKTTKYIVVSSNARSILTKLVYQSLLSSDCRAWALKFRKCLKKQQNFPSKIG